MSVETEVLENASLLIYQNLKMLHQTLLIQSVLLQLYQMLMLRNNVMQLKLR